MTGSSILPNRKLGRGRGREGKPPSSYSNPLMRTTKGLHKKYLKPFQEHTPVRSHQASLLKGPADSQYHHPEGLDYNAWTLVNRWTLKPYLTEMEEGLTQRVQHQDLAYFVTCRGQETFCYLSFYIPDNLQALLGTRYILKT